jgi:cation-transporting ATPase 13A3/4/5
MFGIAWLMFSMVVLSAFNLFLLITPPKPLENLLTLMTLPMAARLTLLAVATGNVAVSLAFEQWGSQSVGSVIGAVMRKWQQGRWQVREEKVYKVVEGGMRP